MEGKGLRETGFAQRDGDQGNAGEEASGPVTNAIRVPQQKGYEVAGGRPELRAKK